MVNTKVLLYLYLVLFVFVTLVTLPISIYAVLVNAMSLSWIVGTSVVGTWCLFVLGSMFWFNRVLRRDAKSNVNKTTKPTSKPVGVPEKNTNRKAKPRRHKPHELR